MWTPTKIEVVALQNDGKRRIEHTSHHRNFVLSNIVSWKVYGLAKGGYTSSVYQTFSNPYTSIIYDVTEFDSRVCVPAYSTVCVFMCVREIFHR